MSEVTRLRAKVNALSLRVSTLETKVANLEEGSGGSGGGGSYDSDALLGFAAAGITDTVIKDAINTLIVDLKANSLWTKIKGLYPLANGTTLGVSINFKTPDTGNLTVHPSASPNPFGLKSNGILAATVNGNTFDYLVNDSNSVGLYSSSNVMEAISDFLVSIGSCYWNMHMQWTDGNAYADCYVVPNGRISGPVANTVGHYYMSRVGDEMWFFKNGAGIGSGYNNNPSHSALESGPMYLGNSSTKNYSIFWFGDGLYPAELAILNALVQTYVIAMGRA